MGREHLNGYNCERVRDLETESELGSGVFVVRREQWRELRVEDSVRVQEKTRGRFGLVKSSRIRVKSGKSR